MQNSFNNNTLTIQLDDRIDTTNAVEVEQQIFTLIDTYKPQNLVLDAKALSYISSVGLRAVLKLKKSIAHTQVVNVSPDVYDIFQMTGFTDMMEIKKALREISVDGCEIIGKGGHGTVYRLGEDTIVKLYREKEPLDEIEREISYAKKAFVYGIPTAISYDMVKCGDRYGVVFELINADTLSNRIYADSEGFEGYSEKYSAIVKQLHQTQADTNMFHSMKELYNKWIDDMTAYYTPEEIAVLHEVINSIPDRDTFVHGDIHPLNVMIQNEELLFIDMADLTYGHPIFDYAGIALTHIMAKGYVRQLFGIEPDTAQVLYDNMLKANFPDRTDEELETLKQVILGYASLKYSITPAINKNQPSELNQAITQKAREQIIPNAKRLIGMIDF